MTRKCRRNPKHGDGRSRVYVAECLSYLKLLPRSPNHATQQPSERLLASVKQDQPKPVHSLDKRLCEGLSHQAKMLITFAAGVSVRRRRARKVPCEVSISGSLKDRWMNVIAVLPQAFHSFRLSFFVSAMCLDFKAYSTS